MSESQTPRERRVAFVFDSSGDEWLGGLNYFRSLFSAMQTLPKGRVRLLAFVGCEADTASFGFPPEVEFVRDATFGRGKIKWLLNKLAAQIFHTPILGNRLMRRHGVEILSHHGQTGINAIRSIGWIPDFQHLHLPQFFSSSELRRRDWHFRRLLADCDRVIVSSEAARCDLQRFAPEHVHKARVLRFCARRPSVDTGATFDLRDLYGISGPYFYVPNQLWAHKNHLVVIRALALLRDRYPDLKVICSGNLNDYRNPAHLPALRQQIESLGLAKHFLLLGVIPYPHIAQLMLNAVAVINPSLFEGWSTTVEEAKTLGVPLILSGIDVHREQCANGSAQFFSPLDETALAEAMVSSICNTDRQCIADTLDAALRMHEQRVIEFAQAYWAIVNELDAVPLER